MQVIEVKKLIEAKFPDSVIQVNSNDGSHFDAVIISQLFIKKTRVQQQQLVYSALNQYIAAGDIHAISLKTYTPDEWASVDHS